MDMMASKRAAERWDQIAKPLGSLGLLEKVVIQICGILGTDQPDLSKKALVIMCADNGVVAEGVTQSGQEVTAVVTENFTTGNSCVCIMAEAAGLEVLPVDIGVARELQQIGSKHPFIQSKIRLGTGNMRYEPAMTRGEAEQAIAVGKNLAKQLKKDGYHLVALGEMGIGNTTTSSAVAAVLTGLMPVQLTGRGAGLSEMGLKHKIQVIEEAIAAHRPDCNDPIEVLAKIGGLDLAGLTGVCLGAAACQLPVVLDGFITATAALTACAIDPQVRDYLVASHCSKEPGGAAVLDYLKLTPVIHAQMCLGEGSGAVAFIPLLEMALAVYQKMSTFEENKIEEYRPL